MAITIQTFKADESQMEILVISDSPIASATLILTDGSSEDITSYFAPGPGVDEYSATIADNRFKDGVFTLDISNTGADNLIVSIGNLLVGNQALLAKTLDETYDCILLQQLEAVRQLILAVEGALASSLYQDVLNKVTPCSDNAMFEFHIEKTSIWIEDNKFVLY